MDPARKAAKFMKKILIALCFIPAVMLLSACNNTQTFASQCAYHIGNGYFDARHVQNILHPGERKNSNNVTTRYVYCNARNYIVAQSKDATADQYTPIEAKTGKNQYGDGTPLNSFLSAHFTLNQNEDVMLKFLAFCEKYNCFAPKDTSNNTGTHSSSEGWNTMLAENMRFALQRATQQAMLKFAPDIWNDQSKWPAVADAISANMKEQLHSQTGINIDFFCGTGAHLLAGKDEHKSGSWTCPPISITIDNILPQDPNVVSIYNKEVQQQNLRQLAGEEQKTNEAQLAAAKAKYGPYAEYFLGLEDTCHAGTTCVIGNVDGALNNVGK